MDEKIWLIILAILAFIKKKPETIPPVVPPPPTLPVVPTCPFCGAMFGTVVELQVHIMAEHPEQGEVFPLRCPICGLEVPTQARLDEHMKTAHATIPLLSTVVAIVFDRKRNVNPIGLPVVLDGSITEVTREGGIAEFKSVQSGLHTLSVVSEDYTQVTSDQIQVRPGEGVHEVRIILEPVEVLCSGQAQFIDDETGQGVQKVIDVRHFSVAVTLTSPSGRVLPAELRGKSFYPWMAIAYETRDWTIKVVPQGAWTVDGRTFRYSPATVQFEMKPRGWVYPNVPLRREYIT